MMNEITNKTTTIFGKITVVAARDLFPQLVEDVKDLNMETTTLERKAAKVIIKITTAVLIKFGLIKNPSWSERTVLKFSKGRREHLAILTKAATFGVLLLGNTWIKFGDIEDEFAKVFGVKLDSVQRAIDVAKVVLFEELLDILVNEQAITDWILKADNTVGEEEEKKKD